MEESSETVDTTVTPEEPKKKRGVKKQTYFSMKAGKVKSNASKKSVEERIFTMISKIEKGEVSATAQGFSINFGDDSTCLFKSPLSSLFRGLKIQAKDLAKLVAAIGTEGLSVGLVPTENFANKGHAVVSNGKKTFKVPYVIIPEIEIQTFLLNDDDHPPSLFVPSSEFFRCLYESVNVFERKNAYHPANLTSRVWVQVADHQPQFTFSALGGRLANVSTFTLGEGRKPEENVPGTFTIPTPVAVFLQGLDMEIKGFCFDHGGETEIVIEGGVSLFWSETHTTLANIDSLNNRLRCVERMKDEAVDKVATTEDLIKDLSDFDADNLMLSHEKLSDGSNECKVPWAFAPDQHTLSDNPTFLFESDLFKLFLKVSGDMWLNDYALGSYQTDTKCYKTLVATSEDQTTIIAGRRNL